jgi:hypothetical protein
MLDSIPSPEKPWNERWAVLLRPSVSESEIKVEMKERLLSINRG